MKIITGPTIYVVGRQQIDIGNIGDFLADHNVESWGSDSQVPGEVLSEMAGRVCYMSFASPRPGGNSAYLQHIKESSHGSVVEHAVWSFIITGVSRSLTHELIRHRAGVSPSQLSQRYVDESVAEYICPDIIWQDADLRDIWLRSVKQSHDACVELANQLAEKLNAASAAKYGFSSAAGKTESRKAARQAARSVLPNATETKVFLTMNARAIRNILEQRGSAHAEPEIRKLANKLLDVMQVESPSLFGDYERKYLPDGTFEITTEHRKV